MQESYKTVAETAGDEYIVKRSRFIGYASPVQSVQQATDFISQIKSRHWDATHNVYAYVLRNGQIKRYSDDGEPQGTAGIPVLDVLQKQEITDCAVVVTRYFGGVLLGAGGLVRAYSHAAKIAIDSAKPIIMSMCLKVNVTVDYSFYNKLLTVITQQGGTVLDSRFFSLVSVDASVPQELFDNLNAQIFDQSFGKYKFTVTGKEYLPCSLKIE